MFHELTIKRKIIFLMGFMVTSIPIVLVAVLSYAYYLFGVEAFFSTKVNNAVNDTVKVAELYLQEHKEKVKVDVLSAAHNLELNRYTFARDPELLQLFVDQFTNARGLSYLMIFKKNHNIVARNFLGFSLIFEDIPSKMLEKLDVEEVMVLEGSKDHIMRAVVKAGSFLEDAYIMIGRRIDPAILEHLKKTKGSAEEYRLLLGGMNITKNKLELIFILSSVLLLIISVIIARRFAYYIITPLEKLSEATIAIQEGDFTVRVPVSNNNDEIYSLSKAFNIMTQRISEQRIELIEANNLIEARRRFMEVVLAEVSAGVLAVDISSKITLHNAYAAILLKKDLSNNNMALNEVFPELQELFYQACTAKIEMQVEQLNVSRKGSNFIFSIRAGPVFNSNDEIESIVITFSNITDLIANQKMAAWADIAKRIAHEIKNPLTPIAMAAERLKRKYHHEIKSDQVSFERYIDTIIRHVYDIEIMVREFVEFARIPLPVIKQNNIVEIIEESILLQRVANNDIEYRFDKESDHCYVNCDYGQVLRVLNNLFNNAVDAVKAKRGSSDSILESFIKIKLRNQAHKDVVVSIVDSGTGIDCHMLANVLEPYVSTKKHGTGVGLPIVKKIIEEHGGKFWIRNHEAGGAEACFTLKLFNQHCVDTQRH